MARTPGPWGVADAGQFIIVGGGPDNDDIASFFYRDEATVRISREAALANAALCAAAPDLLAALKGMVAEFDKFSRYGSPIARDANEAMRSARAAIAKATGDAA